MINKKNLISLAQKLIRTDTSNPPGNEGKVVEILADRLQKLGLKIKIFSAARGRPNLLATWKGKPGKTLILQGHTDTVPAGPGWKFDPFSGKILNGKIYGRGATDMKGCLAAMVAAIEALKKEGWKPNGNLAFLACPNEEMGDKEEIGVKYVAKKIKADLIIVGDVSNFNIVVAEKGTLWLELVSKGLEAHGSMPWKGINAVEKLTKVLNELDKIKFSVSNVLLGESTLSINTISGGFKTNVIPALAKATLDIRLVPDEKKGRVINEIKALIKKLKEKDKDIDIEVNEKLWSEPVQINYKKPFIPLLGSTVEEVLKRKTDIIGEHGATGVGNFIRAGISAVVCGPGKPALCHIKDEHIEIKDLINAAEIYSRFAKKFLS